MNELADEPLANLVKDFVSNLHTHDIHRKPYLDELIAELNRRQVNWGEGYYWEYYWFFEQAAKNG